MTGKPGFRTFGCYFLLSALLFLLMQVTGFNGLYGQDSYEYARHALEWRNFFLHGIHPAPFRWPLLYPAIGGLFSTVIPVQYALQVLSILFLSGSAWITEKTISFHYRTSTPVSRTYALLFLVMSPILLRAGVTAMSDIASMFFIISAAYTFLRLLSSFSPGFLILFALSGAAGLMTRYACAVILLPFFCVLLIRTISIRNIPYFLLAMAAGCLVLAPHLIIQRSHAAGFIHGSWLEEWSPMNFFRSSFSNSNGNYSYTLQNISYSFLSMFHPGYLFFGAVLILFCKRIKPGLAVFTCIASLMVYAFFLAGIPFQNLRFFIPVFPLFLFISYPAIYWLTEMIPVKTMLINSCIFLIQSVLFIRAFLPFYTANLEERELGTACSKLKEGTLYTFGVEGALKFYGVPIPVRSLWDEKISSIPLPAYLLFNPDACEKEFAGRNPMLNYTFIQNHAHLNFMQKFKRGWELYAILEKEQIIPGTSHEIH